MRTRRRIPARLGDSFHVTAAARAGVGRSRVDADDLHRPFLGVRSTTAPVNLHDHARHYSRRMKVNQRFAARTAAQIWGLPLPDRWSPAERLDVVVPPDCAPPRVAGVAGRRLSESRAVTWRVQGLRVVDPVAAVFGAASALAVDDIVVLLDALITTAMNYPGLSVPRPLASLAEVEQRLSEWGRFAGSGRVRAAMPLVRERVESPKETATRLLMVRAGLPEPVVQHELILDGRRARLDLAYPELHVAIEYEGDAHRSDRGQWRRDIRRHRLLQDLGWIVIRVTQDDLDAPDDVLTRIRRAIAPPTPPT